MVSTTGDVLYISRFFEAMLHKDAIARIIDPYGGPSTGNCTVPARRGRAVTRITTSSQLDECLQHVLSHGAEYAARGHHFSYQFSGLPAGSLTKSIHRAASAFRVELIENPGNNVVSISAKVLGWL